MNPFRTTAHPGVCALAAKHFRRQARRLRKQLDGIRAADDIECIHRARVASRRLRAGLRMFQECLKPKVYRRWRKHIRGITSGLGDARDLDVHIEFLCHALCAIGETSLVPGVAKVLADLETQRERLQPEVVKAVGRIARSGVLDEMRAAVKKVQSPNNGAGPASRSEAVYREAEGRIHAQLDELRSHEGGLADPLAVTEHHAMRIAAKRLRYTLEIVKAPYGGTLDEMIGVTRRVQVLLGDIHDCDVWAERLDAFASRQRQRILDRYGHERPYGRLAPGIEHLRESRARDRERRFQELVGYWETLKRDGTWEELRRRAAAAGNPPAETAEPAPPADSPGCVSDQNGRNNPKRNTVPEASLAAFAGDRKD